MKNEKEKEQEERSRIEFEEEYKRIHKFLLFNFILAASAQLKNLILCFFIKFGAEAFNSFKGVVICLNQNGINTV